ncbi:unnamed protein product [Choristocarpus tenellus]
METSKLYSAEFCSARLREVETEVKKSPFNKACSGGRRRSCNRCSFKKEKCSGDEPCERCTKAKATCLYSMCRTLGRPKLIRSTKKRTASKQQPDPTSKESLKRVTLSPSPATGLPGMIEDRYLNCFLDDFTPFYSITDDRRIRAGLIAIMTGSVGEEIVNGGRSNRFALGERILGDSSKRRNTRSRDQDLTMGSPQDYAIVSTLFSGMALGGLMLGASTEKIQPYLGVALTSMGFCDELVSEIVFSAHFLLAMVLLVNNSCVPGESYATRKELATKCLTQLMCKNSGQLEQSQGIAYLEEVLKHRMTADGVTGAVTGSKVNMVTPIVPRSSFIKGSTAGGGIKAIKGRCFQNAVPVRMSISMFEELGLSGWSPGKDPPVLGSGLMEMRALVMVRMKQLVYQSPLGGEDRRSSLSDYLLGGTFMGLLTLLKKFDDMLLVAQDMVAAIRKCPGVTLFQPHALHIALGTLKAHGKHEEYELIHTVARCDKLPTFDELIPDVSMCKSPVCHGFVKLILSLGEMEERKKESGLTSSQLPSGACNNVKDGSTSCGKRIRNSSGVGNKAIAIETRGKRLDITAIGMGRDSGTSHGKGVSDVWEYREAGHSVEGMDREDCGLSLNNEQLRQVFASETFSKERDIKFPEGRLEGEELVTPWKGDLEEEKQNAWDQIYLSCGEGNVNGLVTTPDPPFSKQNLGMGEDNEGGQEMMSQWQTSSHLPSTLDIGLNDKPPKDMIKHALSTLQSPRHQCQNQHLAHLDHHEPSISSLSLSLPGRAGLLIPPPCCSVFKPSQSNFHPGTGLPFVPFMSGRKPHSAGIGGDGNVSGDGELTLPSPCVDMRDSYISKSQPLFPGDRGVSMIREYGSLVPWGHDDQAVDHSESIEDASLVPWAHGAQAVDCSESTDVWKSQHLDLRGAIQTRWPARRTRVAQED